MFAFISKSGRFAPSALSFGEKPAVAMPARGKKASRPMPMFETLEGRQLMSATVSGIVYNDLNVANTFKAGDPMLAGVRVYADLGNHNAYKAGDPTAITNAQGAYTLSGLGAGTYELRQVVPAGFRQSEPSNGVAHSVTVGSSSHLTKVNFGDTQKVRVSGFVFNDSNGDGAQDHGEGIVSGVAVYLDANGNKHLDAGELHTTTDATGYWVIGDLPPGKTYDVQMIAPAGFVQTDPSANGGHIVTLQNGKTADNLLFGIRPSTVVINSQIRTAVADAGSKFIEDASTSVGVFDASATATDPVLGDSGTYNYTSNITATTIRAIGSLSATGSHDVGEAYGTVDVVFTLSAATNYSYGYDIFGNSFKFELVKYGNGNGNTTIINNGPSNDPSVTNYASSNSGTLAAGKYELIFDATQSNSNIFGTNSYLMNFNL